GKIVSRSVTFQFRAEYSRPRRTTEPNLKGTRKTADRPFLDYSLQAGRCGTDPEINGEIVGPKIASGVPKGNKVVDSVKAEGLAHLASSKSRSVLQRAIGRIHHI